MNYKKIKEGIINIMKEFDFFIIGDDSNYLVFKYCGDNVDYEICEEDFNCRAEYDDYIEEQDDIVIANKREAIKILRNRNNLKIENHEICYDNFEPEIIIYF